jgi:hypothetical protein
VITAIDALGRTVVKEFDDVEKIFLLAIAARLAKRPEVAFFDFEKRTPPAW